jgi:hypothetical protein
MMTMQSGLPVAGYQPQSPEKIDLVNQNKMTEETLLRSIEAATKSELMDPRWAAIAKTDLEKAFMSLNRAVFQPSRVRLPVDDETPKGTEA